MKDIIRAVAKLHDHGIFHGDIKSSNVCLKKNKAYLIDYEFATVGKQPSQGRGTRYYRRSDYSPSVRARGAYSLRQRDFFALGILLIELFRGKFIQDLVNDNAEKKVFRSLFENILLSLHSASYPVGEFIRHLIGLNNTFKNANKMQRFFANRVVITAS